MDTMIMIERIKCYLRANWFYKKYLQTRVNDMRYFVRSCKYYVKYYSFKYDKAVTGHTLYFIIDPEIRHPGLADRYKAIVGCYFIAQQNGFDFKIIFETPFSLHNYLDENQCKWYADRQALSFSLRNSRVIAYNGGGKIPRLRRSVKQYHVYSYIGYDMLETNRIPEAKKRWGELYNALFRPKELIIRRMAETGFVKDAYIAVHLRFVNALEHFEEDHFNDLSQTSREELIRRCLAGIEAIRKLNEDLPLLVFSDSRVFLDRVKTLPVHVLAGTIGHISFVHDEEAVIKTFVDFYMIGNAKRVYIIQAPELYSTVYSYYAALTGYKEAITFYL